VGEDERRRRVCSVFALPHESLRLDIKEGVNEAEGVGEPDDGAR
jgi:hypothetical protein